jgi:hypothetical protein
LKPEERRLIIGIGSLFFIVEAGLAIGASGVEALFLSRFGSEALPYMFIAIGVAVPIAVLLTTGAIHGCEPGRSTVWSPFRSCWCLSCLDWRSFPNLVGSIPCSTFCGVSQAPLPPS